MSVLFTILGIICIIAGRVATFDLTEGQAFVEGWIYWLGAVSYFYLAFAVRKAS